MASYLELLMVDFECLPMFYLGNEADRNSGWLACPPKDLLSQLVYTPLPESLELGNLYRI